LSPSNVLIDRTQHAYLLDFELAARIGDRGVPGAGTRGYASPQQRRGEPADTLDDVFGLGSLIAYGTCGPRWMVSMRHAAPAIHDVVRRARSPVAQNRFPDVQAMMNALDRIALDLRPIEHERLAGPN
jgi:serine/threonine-protein kinase